MNDNLTRPQNGMLLDVGVSQKVNVKKSNFKKIGL